MVFCQCIDNTELTLPFDEPMLVVDAMISNKSDESYIKIGWSAPIGSICNDGFIVGECEIDNSTGPYKVTGSATVRDEVTGEQNILQIFMKDKKGLIELKPTLTGKPGHLYTLNIMINYEGAVSTYFAESTMKMTPTIDKIGYVIRKGDIGKSDNLVPLISFRDDPLETDYYLFQLCDVHPGGNINCAKSRVWPYSFISDRFLPEYVQDLSIDDGASVARYAEFYPMADSNFGALVKMYSVSRETYEFYKTLLEQFNSDGGAFSPTPSSPKGNIKGALGHFAALHESSAVIFQ